MRIAALVLAASAAVLLIGYLAIRPPLTPAVRLYLLAAVGLLPLGAALTGNVATFEVTTHNSFCSSCHLMVPFTSEAADPQSSTIVALHSRNRAFGDKSCYACHRDYGLFGTVTTKLGGLRHAWAYYAAGWDEPVELYQPYPKSSCTYCHSMMLPGFAEEPEHAAMQEELDQGSISCTASGCHGPVHPRAKGAR